MLQFITVTDHTALLNNNKHDVSRFHRLYGLTYITVTYYLILDNDKQYLSIPCSLVFMW